MNKLFWVFWTLPLLVFIVFFFHPGDKLSFSSPPFVFTDSKDKALCHLCVPKGPLTAPLNLRVSDIESTQVTLHWDPVTRSSIMGELKEYKVCLLWRQYGIRDFEYRLYLLTYSMYILYFIGTIHCWYTTDNKRTTMTLRFQLIQ